MQNKPNFQKVQMVISLVNTRNYNNEQRTMNYSKQTQPNPILTRVTSHGARATTQKACTELVEVSNEKALWIEDRGGDEQFR